MSTDNNKKLFDSTQLDENQYENLLLVTKQIRYAEIQQIKMALGENATAHKKLFNNLFDLTHINSNLETRNVMQFKAFQELKDKADRDVLVNHIKRMKDTYPFIKDRNITKEYRLIEDILQSIIDLNVVC